MKQEIGVSKLLENFLNGTNELIQLYQLAYNTVSDCEAATQDLLHQIELGPTKDRNKSATLLAKVRKERRNSKDIVEIADPLVTYLQSTEMKKVIHNLQEILGKVRKQEKLVETHSRIYIPRVINGLTINQERSQSNDKR